MTTHERTDSCPSFCRGTAHDREEAVKALREAIIEGAVLTGAENFGEAALDYLDANPAARAALARYLAPDAGRDRLREALDRAAAMIDNPAHFTERSGPYRAGWVDAIRAVRDDPAIADLHPHWCPTCGGAGHLGPQHRTRDDIYPEGRACDRCNGTGRLRE
jgi:hypothetical protein